MAQVGGVLLPRGGMVEAVGGSRPCGASLMTHDGVKLRGLVVMGGGCWSPPDGTGSRRWLASSLSLRPLPIHEDASKVVRLEACLRAREQLLLQRAWLRLEEERHW